MSDENPSKDPPQSAFLLAFLAAFGLLAAQPVDEALCVGGQREEVFLAVA